MNEAAIIKAFYNAFAQKEVEAMVALYHDDVIFRDPAFGTLRGEEAKNMWRMLIARGGEKLQVTFDVVTAQGGEATAVWVAIYPYGPKKRPVINRITAHMTIRDGKIVAHHDAFDLWKWARMALGPAGWLLGWSGWMHNKIQIMARSRLKAYCEKQASATNG